MMGALLVAPSFASAATIRVETNADEFGVAGNCSLREAIQSANENSNEGGCKRKGGGGADTIVLTSEIVYRIAIAGGNDDTNATGDFDIASNITLEASDKRKANIDANDVDRAFDVLQGGKLTASKLYIVNGSPPSNGFSYGGGAILNRGKLYLRASKLAANSAENGQAINGGAIDAAANGGRTILDRVT